MYRTTFHPPYDSMSEFEDDDAQEEKEEDTDSPQTRLMSQPQATDR